jgi:hypothetical protein
MTLNLRELIDNQDVTKQDVIIILNHWQQYYGGKGKLGLVKFATESIGLPSDYRVLYFELLVFEPNETGEGLKHQFGIFYLKGKFINVIDYNEK